METQEQRLDRLISEAITLIRKAEPLALTYSPEGFTVAFSGGKDSQVILWLAEHAGVKFHAEMQNTTIETPELMRFVREHYINTGKVHLNHPVDKDGNRTNFWKKLQYHGIPTRMARWCCQELKEFASKNCVTITGVRQNESRRRAEQNPQPLKVIGKNRKKTKLYEGPFSTITTSTKLRIKHIDLFAINKETLIECAGGGDSVVLSPIFNWTDEDVWALIHREKMPYCELYDQGYTRIGCIMCPMESMSKRKRDMDRYPLFVKAYKRTLESSPKLVERINNLGFYNTDEFLQWYAQNKTVKDFLRNKHAIKLFDFEQPEDLS